MKIGAGGLQIQVAQEVNPVRKVEPVEKVKDQKPSQMDAGQAEPKNSPEDLIKAVDKLNDSAKIFNRHLKFQVHQETQRVIVKVVDEEGQVKAEIPPEKVLKMLAEIQESMGIIVDKYF